MSTKPQLQKRWKSEPGKLIRELILAKVVPHTREALPHALRFFTSFSTVCLFGKKFPMVAIFAEATASTVESLIFQIQISPLQLKLALLSNATCHEASLTKARKTAVKSRSQFLLARPSDVSISAALASPAAMPEGRVSTRHGSIMRILKMPIFAAHSFRGADLKRAAFYAQNFQGCDFRGANLMESALNGAEVDGTTDFRGACLINAYLNKRCDNFGNLVAAGIDLKTVKIDATTRLGDDPKAEALEILKAALEVSSDRCNTESMRRGGHVFWVPVFCTQNTVPALGALAPRSAKSVARVLRFAAGPICKVEKIAIVKGPAYNRGVWEGSALFIPCAPAGAVGRRRAIARWSHPTVCGTFYLFAGSAPHHPSSSAWAASQHGSSQSGEASFHV